MAIGHGMDYTDTEEKCRQLKILTCKVTLRQVLIRINRLEIQSVMLVFSIQLCELLPLSPFLWFNSPPPPSPRPCVNTYSVNTYTVCKGGGWGSGPQTDKHLPQSPFSGHFIRWHFALPSMSLIVLCSMVSNRLQCIVHTICSLSCAQYLNFLFSYFIGVYLPHLLLERGRKYQSGFNAR
jgi:hypothetical protein